MRLEASIQEMLDLCPEYVWSKSSSSFLILYVWAALFTSLCIIYFHYCTVDNAFLFIGFCSLNIRNDEPALGDSLLNTTADYLLSHCVLAVPH